RMAGDHSFESAAFQQLHNHEVTAVLAADFVDGADVGMVERRGSAGLALKSLQSLWVARQLFREELQSDAPPQGEVLGLIDHAHPATAELLQNAVMGDGLTNHGAALC